MTLCWAAGIIQGEIKLEGHDKEQGPFARISGYVEQVSICDVPVMASTCRHCFLLPRKLQKPSYLARQNISNPSADERKDTPVLIGEGMMMQADIHSPATTVREALYFSARCRLMDVDADQLNEFVEEVSCLMMPC